MTAHHTACMHCLHSQIVEVTCVLHNIPRKTSCSLTVRYTVCLHCLHRQKFAVKIVQESQMLPCNTCSDQALDLDCLSGPMHAQAHLQHQKVTAHHPHFTAITAALHCTALKGLHVPCRLHMQCSRCSAQHFTACKTGPHEFGTVPTWGETSVSVRTDGCPCCML